MERETVVCHKCGKEEPLQWVPAMNDRLRANKTCFNCDFWLELVAVKDEPCMVRRDGMHYCINDEKSIGMRGFGGTRFKIQFHDGRYVESTNLWCQGHIPEHFRDLLPDNAVFIRDA